MNRLRSSLTVIFTVLLLALTYSSVMAKTNGSSREINLKVALGTPVMEAGKVQRAFLKVSLKGFEVLDKSDRTPVNVAIVLDRSGSMQGEKLRRAKEAASMAINMLNSNDIASVVVYDSVVNVIMPATKVRNKGDFSRAIEKIHSGGSTALFAGVSKGAYELRKFLDKNKVNRVILLSDGLANVGPDSPAELGELGASFGREGISVTTIGLGLGYNEDLMTKLAGYSDGNHAFVENSQDLAQIFEKEFESAMSVVAKELKIIIHCKGRVNPIRVYGRDAEIMGQDVRVNLNQISSNQEKFILLEVEVPAGKPGDNVKLASVDVSYLDLQNKRSQHLQDSVGVGFTRKKEEVRKSMDKKVMESAVDQIANERTKEAVRLRDEGKFVEAEQSMEDTADFLQENAVILQSPALEHDSIETRKDAKDFGAGAKSKWNSKRKTMKERQYKKSTQQKY